MKEEIVIEASCFPRPKEYGEEPCEENGWDGQVCISPFFIEDRKKLLEFIKSRQHYAFTITLSREMDDTDDTDDPSNPDWGKRSKFWKEHYRYDAREVEWVCEHGIGHWKWPHSCDGCCRSESYPGRKKK